MRRGCVVDQCPKTSGETESHFEHARSVILTPFLQNALPPLTVSCFGVRAHMKRLAWQIRFSNALWKVSWVHRSSRLG